MAPTINNGGSAVPPTDKKSELLVRVKYGNSLPDIPFDLKFLQHPFDSQRFVQYNPTSLERNYKYEVLTEHDLGVSIDLINRDLYQADPYATMEPPDEKLLEEDVHTQHDSVRSRQHSRSVSWLRKSEYISTEQTRFQPQNLEQIEAKVGYNVKKSLREETLYLDREAQIRAIEKTFTDSKADITKHYSKPNVVPVEVLPIYPDFVNWKYPCAQVIFDSDPAPQGKNVPAQLEEMSQAMIRGVMDESGAQFVAYFLPTETTLEKRRVDAVDGVLYKDDEEYEYKIAREYNWNVKSKASKGYEENYFFVCRSDGVYYNELETRVRLNKRRVKVGQQPSNTKLVVKHRPLDANEHAMQRYREKQLEPAGDDDEEEMEVPDEDNEDQEAEGKEEGANEKGASKGDNAETAEESKDDKQTERDRASRSSGSRSRSRSKTRTPSPGGSRGSRSRSRSRSNSKSPSRSRSRSRSSSRSRSRTRSRSGSSSRSGSRSSRSRSRSASGSRSSRSGSNDSRNSKHSGSRTPNKSRSNTRSRSRSGSRSGSGSGSSSEQE